MLTLLLRAVPEVLCQPCRAKLRLNAFLHRDLATTNTFGKQRGIVSHYKKHTHIHADLVLHCMLMLEQHAHTREANVVPVKEGVEAVVNVRDVILYVDLHVQRTFKVVL